MDSRRTLIYWGLSFFFWLSFNFCLTADVSEVVFRKHIITVLYYNCSATLMLHVQRDCGVQMTFTVYYNVIIIWAKVSE